MEKKNKGVVKGVGNDLIEVFRIEKAIRAHGQVFLNRLFTPFEQEYCKGFKDSELHFAGRFVAKEAIAKAIGFGFGSHLSWLDIEILNNERGKPSTQLSPSLLLQLDPSSFIFVSISHCKDYAAAVAIWTV